MALVKCEECGHEISDKATACPHCGCPISAAKAKAPKWFENAGKWANQLVVKMKNLPRKAVAICTVLVVLLVVLLCIPKGADKDKSILKEHLLDPASLTIYEAYTNDDYGEGGRATLFYFGAKIRLAASVTIGRSCMMTASSLARISMLLKTVKIHRESWTTET